MTFLLMLGEPDYHRLVVDSLLRTENGYRARNSVSEFEYPDQRKTLYITHYFNCLLPP